MAMEGTADSSEKISEALKLLEEAAKEKKEDLRKLASDKYVHLKSALASAEHTAAETLSAAQKRAIEAMIHAREVGTEKVKQAATVVDDHVRANPWPYLGGTAIVALLTGYFMGRKR